MGLGAALDRQQGDEQVRVPLTDRARQRESSHGVNGSAQAALEFRKHNPAVSRKPSRGQLRGAGRGTNAFIAPAPHTVETLREDRSILAGMLQLRSPGQRKSRHGSRLSWWAACLLLVVIHSLPTADAVKRHDFKTCDQSGFCKRNRALADRAVEHADHWRSPYHVHDPKFARGAFTAAVSNGLFPEIKFALELRFLKDGTARVLMDEVDGLRQRYNEAARWALEGEPAIENTDSSFRTVYEADCTTITYAEGRHQVRIDHSPLTVTFFRDGQPHVILNDRKLFNMEHFRVKTVGEQPEEIVVQDPAHPEEQLVVVKDEAFPGFLPPTEDGMWEETFAGKTDSKPKGTGLSGVHLNSRGWILTWTAQAPNHSVSTSRSRATSTCTAFPNTPRPSA